MKKINKSKNGKTKERKEERKKERKKERKANMKQIMKERSKSQFIEPKRNNFNKRNKTTESKFGGAIIEEIKIPEKLNSSKTFK